MRNWTRSSLVAGMLLVSLLAAGCAASPGERALSGDAQQPEIAGPAGIEPAGGAQGGVGRAKGAGGGAAVADPDAPVAAVGGAAVTDPAAPAGTVGAPAAQVDPRTPVGSAGGGFAGMDGGPSHATAPGSEGAGSSAYPGIDPVLVEQCGEDGNVRGEGRSPDRRKCLWDAYLANRPATFRTVAYTVEGDPIAFDVSVQHRDQIAVRVDSEDRFGAMGQFAYTCTAMEFIDDSRFVLKGCTPSDPGSEGAFVTEDGELYIR